MLPLFSKGEAAETSHETALDCTYTQARKVVPSSGTSPFTLIFLEDPGKVVPPLAESRATRSDYRAVSAPAAEFARSANSATGGETAL